MCQFYSLSVEDYQNQIRFFFNINSSNKKGLPTHVTGSHSSHYISLCLIYSGPDIVAWVKDVARGSTQLVLNECIVQSLERHIAFFDETIIYLNLFSTFRKGQKELINASLKNHNVLSAIYKIWVMHISLE